MGRGIKCTDLEKRSTTDRMTVLPSEGGRPVESSGIYGTRVDEVLAGVGRALVGRLV